MCIRTIISMENPDFVAYSGDMVTGNCWDGSKDWFRRQWNDVTRVVSEWKIPYDIGIYPRHGIVMQTKQKGY